MTRSTAEKEKNLTPHDITGAKMRHRKKKFTNEQIADALEKTHGLVHIASAKLGCHFSTIYRRLDEDSTLRDLLDNLRGEFLDVASDQLYKAVERGEWWAVRFVLLTLGKSRGYSYRDDTSKPKEPTVKIIFKGKKGDSNAETIHSQR